MADLNCPNCGEVVKETWKTCPECHADLSKRKYTKADDPIENLKGDVDEIKDFLHKKFPENKPPDPNEPPKEKKDAKKRKPLFS